MSTQHDATILLHAGQVKDPATNARAVPIYQTTSYLFNDTAHASRLFGLQEFGNIYTRLMNPTTAVLEQRLAALEGGSGALACSSGMAAIFLAIHNIANAGDHLVSSASLYGGTETLFRHQLPKLGITTTFIDDMTPAKLDKAIKKNTKVVYAESIGNPRGDVLDLAALAEVCHRHGVCFMVDNTFSPLICKPISHGVDVVVHSCTKWIGGHGTSIGGIIIDSGKFNWGNGRYPDFTTPDASYHGLVYWDALQNVPGMGNIAYIIKARVQGMRNLGMCPSPFNAFLFLQGLETLHLRLPRHGENALALARWLRQHPLVSWVLYTGLEDHPHHAMARKYLKGGFGSVFGFGPKGGYAAAEKFINACKLASHLANVGDAKTLVLHPASTSHRQLNEEAQRACGLSPDFVRISVGLEDLEDIKADFDQALRAAQA